MISSKSALKRLHICIFQKTGIINIPSAMISSKRALKRENRRPPASVSPHPASLREDSTRILHRSWTKIFTNIGKVKIFGIQPQYFHIQHPIFSLCVYRSGISKRRNAILKFSIQQFMWFWIFKQGFKHGFFGKIATWKGRLNFSKKSSLLVASPVPYAVSFLSKNSHDF